jgi:hypothetical protein
LRKAISKRETEIADAIAATDKQLAEVIARLEDLNLASRGRDETEADEAGAIGQIEDERTSLSASRKLLQELLAVTQAAVANAIGDQSRVVVTFGKQNAGLQIAVNSGPISITFGKGM